MSILDTFFIMFDADTSQLKTGLRDVGRETEIMGRKVTNADQRLTRMLRRSISILAVIGGLKATIDFSQELYKSSEQLGVGIEKLGAWSAAVVKAGGESTDFQQSLLEFAKKFNISADEAIDKLPHLADQLSKLNHIEALKVGGELGLNESTIALLRKGREEVEKLVKEQVKLGLVTREDADIIHKFTQQFENTSHVFGVFGTRILGDLLPFLGRFFGYIQEGVGTLNKYPYLIEGITFALTGLAGILLLVAGKAALAFLPFGLVGLTFLAIGAAAILAYDDIKTFIEGGDSLIGRAIEEWPKLNSVIERIADTINGLVDAWNYLDYVAKVGYWDADSFSDWQQKQAGNAPLGQAAQLSARSSTDIGQSSINKAYSAGPNIPSEVQRNREEALQALSFVGPTTPQQQLRNIQIQQTISEVNINTQATDAQGIARDITSALTNEQRQAVDNFSSGVMY